MSEVNWFYYAPPLNAGLTFGEPTLYDPYEALTILGDPTLKMRRENYNSFPDSEISNRNISFGQVKIGESKEIKIDVKNNGNEKLHITSSYSYKYGNYPEESTTSVSSSISFFIDPFSFDSDSIEKQTTSQITFSFRPQNPGNYSRDWVLLTNDPKYPYLKFNLTGIGVESITNKEKPTVTISQPKQGKSYNGTIKLTGSASDPDGDETIEDVEISINNGIWKTVENTNQWTYNLDTTKLENGENKITVRAYDGQYYSNFTSVKINIDNKKENGTPGFGIFIIIFATVFVIIYFRKKSK